MKIQKISLFLVCSLFGMSVMADGFDKAEYYSSCQGKKGRALKSALAQLIYSSDAAVSYDGLLDAYKTTDVRADGTIWDMYSNVTTYKPGSDFAASYREEGDGYNREHTIPQSIFNEAKPMKSDLYHVYPTDAKINGVRNNYCHGEVAGIKTASKNNFCYLGTPTKELKNEGCNETYVFEPNDEYKGDFARTYFYFVTCYESRLQSFGSYGMFSKDVYPSLTDWAQEMLLRWSEKDEVSKKETDRIEAVYAYQPNRNPFIDFPGLEQYIWGDYQDVPFSPTDYKSPFDGDGSGDTEEEETEPELAPVVTYTFTDKTWSCTADNCDDDAWQSNGMDAYGYVAGQGVQITKGFSGAGATSPKEFSNVVEVDVYYATNSSKGAGTIDVKVGNTEFTSQDEISTNGGTSPRMLTYKSDAGAASGKVQFTVNCTTNSIYVYSICVRSATADGMQDVMVLRPSEPIIYDLSGRRVDPLHLKKGLYVVNGRKVIF